VATKLDLIDWLVEALQAGKGAGRIADLCKHVWETHRADLEKSGDLLYTWQYDIRWAAYQLRKLGKLKAMAVSPKGVWELTTD
jgi:hypothetical protein